MASAGLQSSGRTMNATAYPDFIYKAGITDFLTTVPTVPQDADKDNAVALLGSSPLGVVLVVESPQSQRVTGIITKSDLVKLTRKPPPVLAKDLVPPEGVVGIHSDAKLWQLLRIINGDNKRNMILKQVPVIDKEGNALGVVTRDSLREMIDSVAAKY
jgi:CBS domain-containing protein